MKKLTKQNLKIINRISYVVLIALVVRLMVVFDIPWYEIFIVHTVVLGALWTQRILNLSDGMLYEMMKMTKETDKIINSTLKKKNKRYKVKKKRPRQAR